MILTDKSIIITLAVPVFFLLILIEFLYGLKVGKNNYKLSDTFTSIGLGLISRFPPMLNIGFQGAVFVYAGSYLNLELLPIDSPVTWIVAFLLYDLSYYWMHRMHHEIKVLWATHSVHHHGEEFNLSTALRQTSTGWLWKWIFYLPMIMIGVPGEVFVTVAGVNLVYQFWVHTKHIGHLGILEKIFITPMNHSVHHAKNEEYIDANYGGVFIIWDRMFGTYIPERPDIEPVYGTVKPLNSWNPIWANFQVFYQMVQDTIHTKKISNKIKIWYSSTSWRPEDVIENNPNPDPALFKQKYSPPLNKQQKIFGIIQIFSTIIIAGSITVTLASQTYQETAIFGLIFILSVLLTSYILQNKENSFNIQLGASSILFLAIYFGGLVNLNLLATQLILIHSLVNILYIGISIPMQKFSFKGSIN
ncbi:MAG: sterol desaturase family protein [SAR86 cluster bacterium]|uniref:Sterol desaturase family protein n=1 Tax=SAR86 cluster bacterium TaxID=2030880 RepID=A0A520MD11_9GAMM|nr:MAG: sterol desaturase family protein [SAR86 cluster bacterium]